MIGSKIIKIDWEIKIFKKNELFSAVWSFLQRVADFRFTSLGYFYISFDNIASYQVAFIFDPPLSL